MRFMDLSVVIPTYNEGGNVGKLISMIKEVLKPITSDYEILIIDGNSKDNTQEEARGAGANVLVQTGKGYGNALKLGLKSAKGKYIVTMDADLSHNPKVINELWMNRDKAELVIASRFTKGGSAEMSWSRRFLSRSLNLVFSKVLAIPVKDMSSGYRLYQSKVFKEFEIKGDNYDVLQYILIKIYSSGWKVKEVPFHYEPRGYGETKAKLARFAVSYIKTLFRMWRFRNSLESADYDERAYYSIIPLQRYWQRKRHKVIMRMIPAEFKAKDKAILDVGCGSSKIMQQLNQGIGLDILFKKLRYLKKTNKYLSQGSVFALPFKDDKFDIVICSQVIEHIPADDIIFTELKRVLRKGGILIIGTPDYKKLTWRFIEWIYGKVMPGAYADEHITHYTKKSLKRKLKQFGLRIQKTKYVFNSELILGCKNEE
ncbi:glycosyltransferase [Candidatus Woesearchaeota archaeon]|nr:glycosyltransferase [Candidatus Woesearchaeota archaeon]